VRDLLRAWTPVRAPIDRRTYITHGFALAAVKYAGDVAIVWLMSGRFWTPFDYLASHSILRARFDERWMLLALAVWALPFVWIGVTLSLRRALDAGLSPWLALWFFVPYVNYLLMAALAAAPAFVLNRRTNASRAETFGVIGLVIAVCVGLMVLFALEGLVCLIMSLPIVGAAAIFGAVLGRVLARIGSAGTGQVLFPLLFLPLSLATEPATGRAVHEVVSTIEIDASPAAVWQQVIAFPEIAPPRELLFRAGLAYPMRARIEGQGIGATRYCVFSTGAFVEPITAWEPGRRLAFDVAASPPPLRELTLWEGVQPPHLDGYLRAVRGEFRLVALPGGRTRLEGSTWYTLEMGPEAYWRMWSDQVIHRIHLRVLGHIRHQAEANAAMIRPPATRRTNAEVRH
jgi:uncharacterized membrane protein YhaH (DUF805 family)